MSQEGLIDGVVCLNHDGLLQKAGCPQERLLEVAGSWFDPCNPVLRKSGCMRQELKVTGKDELVEGTAAQAPEDEGTSGPAEDRNGRGDTTGGIYVGGCSTWPRGS